MSGSQVTDFADLSDFAQPSSKPSPTAASAKAPSPRQYLLGLQDSIATTLAAMDGKRFKSDSWRKKPEEPLQGDGNTMILEGGEVFERAGVAFSAVTGKSLPASATEDRPHLAGAPFTAMGVSVVIHPRNPYVPTVHMNVRAISVTPAQGAPALWFGGGMDLTPVYGFDEDAVHFHTVCKSTLAPFGEDKYPRFKKWCDEYFYLKHREEPRGIGGIFFDDFSELGVLRSFDMLRAVGDSFLDAYVPIVGRRAQTVFGEREKSFQLYRRGRYVEFNLVWDRGTHFGLQSGGRTESILMSMPPQASWRYKLQPKPGTAEGKLYTDYLVRKDWV